MKKNNKLTNTIIVLFTAITFFLSNGLFFYYPLAWISPIPLLLILNKRGIRPYFILTFSTYLLGSSIYFFTLKNTIPIHIIVLTIIILALVFSSVFLLTKLISSIINPLYKVFIFPIIWTIVEYIIFSISSNGHWGSIANTQTDFLPILQLSSITGSLGIVFIVSLFPSILCNIWHYRKNISMVLKISTVPIILMLTAFLFGGLKLSTSQIGNKIKVAVYSTDKNISYFKTENPNKAISIVKEYKHKIDTLAKMGAEVILFPEKMIGVTNDYDKIVKNILSEAALENRVMVIIGINHKGDTLRTNNAWIFSEDGELILNHMKNHLVPGWETGKYISGNDIGVFNNKTSFWGVLICKDNDFPNYARKYGQNGVKLVFAPTWDFIEDAEYHMRLALLRSVENGYSLVRSTKQGISSVNNEHGQIIKSLKSYGDNEIMFVAEIQEGRGQTFYSRFGNWFPYCCLIILITLIILSIRNKKNNLFNSFF